MIDDTALGQCNYYDLILLLESGSDKMPKRNMRCFFCKTRIRRKLFDESLITLYCVR